MMNQFNEQNKNKTNTEDIVNAYKSNSGTKTDNSAQIANLYANMNSPSFFNESLSKNIQNINSLLQSKYGANANYENGLGMYQNTGGLTDNKWSPDEVSIYNKYLTDIQNARQGLEQHNQLLNANNQGIAQQSVMADQALKYIPEMLKSSGMGNVGASESTLAGIRNSYAGNIANIQNNTNSNISQLYSDYNARSIDAQNNLDYAKYENNREEKYNNQGQMETLIANTNSLEALDRIYNSYGDSDKNNYMDQLYQTKKEVLQYEKVTSDIESALTKGEDPMGILDDSKDILSEKDYNELSTIINQYKEEYNIGNDTTSFGISDLNPKNFNFAGSGNNKKQDTLINGIKYLAENGYFTNGDLIDMNYGLGSSVYEFRDGKFYKTNKDTIKRGQKGSNGQVMNYLKSINQWR